MGISFYFVILRDFMVLIVELNRWLALVVGFFRCLLDPFGGGVSVVELNRWPALVVGFFRCLLDPFGGGFRCLLGLFGGWVS